MMNELELFNISALMFTLYNGFVCCKFGIPESISSTSYIFKEYNGKPWLFSFMCVIIVVGLFPLWVLISEDCYDWMVFITCAGILFAGATPMFRESFEKPIHYGSGIILSLSMVSWMISSGYWKQLLVIGVLSLCSILFFDKSKYVYYFEIFAYYIIATILIVGALQTF